jgi:hypothetical protein
VAAASNIRGCLANVLALPPGSRLDADWGTNDATSGIGSVMGGAHFALMIVGTVTYVAGYFMIEDLLAYFK